MNRHNPYSVPKDYFSDLKKSITERVQSIEQSPTPIESVEFDLDEKPVTWSKAWRQLMGFAAAFAVMVGMGWLFVHIASNGEQVSSQRQEIALLDTARILWMLEEQDVVNIIDHHQNESIIMAQAAEEYFDFFCEVDDINLIYYD